MVNHWSACLLIRLANVLVVLAAGASATPFTINFSFSGSVTPSQQAIITSAGNTWMSLLPNYQAGINISSLNILADGSAIDGGGGVLAGSFAPATTTQGGFVLATSGTIQFDSADLANMESNGTLLTVALHEVAHIMGFGTLWTNNGVYVSGSGQYTGPNALTVYKTEFNQPSATYIPVELGGGSGAANGHWDEVDGGACCTGRVSAQGDMTNELMTAWVGSSTYLSNTTVYSFVDLGYATAAVPEPATVGLISAGLGLIGFLRRRSR